MINRLALFIPVCMIITACPSSNRGRVLQRRDTVVLYDLSNSLDSASLSAMNEKLERVLLSAPYGSRFQVFGIGNRTDEPIISFEIPQSNSPAARNDSIRHRVQAELEKFRNYVFSFQASNRTCIISSLKMARRHFQSSDGYVEKQLLVFSDMLECCDFETDSGSFALRMEGRKNYLVSDSLFASIERLDLAGLEGLADIVPDSCIDIVITNNIPDKPLARVTTDQLYRAWDTIFVKMGYSENSITRNHFHLNVPDKFRNLYSGN